MRFFHICPVSLACVVSAAFFWSCENETDLSLDNQRTSIERYLDGRGADYVRDGDVFVNILGNSLPAWETPTPVERGDSVWFMFAAYVFSGSSAASQPFYTNIAELAESIEGLDTQYWSFEPVGVKAGATPIINGIAVALPYCHYGDSVEVYMTSEMAYGDKNIGMIDRNTALKFMLEIERVKKND